MINEKLEKPLVGDVNIKENLTTDFPTSQKQDTLQPLNQSTDKDEDLDDLSLDDLPLDANGLPILEDESLEFINEHQIPQYLVDVYNWCYVKPKNIDLLDRPLVYHTILFGQGGRLMKEYLKEIPETSRMLQTAHVYGNFVKHLAKKVALKGTLDIIDVVPYQLKKAALKLKGVEGEENIDMWLQDASHPYYKEYDVIGIYFLLHEVPDPVKKHIIENALKVINETNGKVVFVDYHNPHPYHPVRQILRLVNFFLEPFANSLWEREIKHFTNKYDSYNWKKTTYFGGVYQKVVVTKKEPTDEDILNRD